MINTIERYTECGSRAGDARKNRDESRYRFERDWFNRARARESVSDRNIADRAFNDAYEEAARDYSPIRY